jgi:ATP-dependent Lon protease
VKLVIQRYTREAGVRSLERNLAALARAAAVRVAEQEQAVPLSKDVHQLASPLLENRLADGGEVEMEVIPMAVNNHELSNTFRIASPLVMDEAMLEKVLGVMIFLSLFFFYVHFYIIRILHFGFNSYFYRN